MFDYSLDSDGVATLTIDLKGRSMNVFTEDGIAQLADLVEKIAADEVVKGVIITSGKPAFLAGADLPMLLAMTNLAKTAGAQEVFELAFQLNGILRRLETCGKPFACALNGLAMGGGLELAMACHYRVCADDPRIQLALPEVKIGILPGAGGTQRLSRLVGVQNAAPYLLEGHSMDPKTALSLGVVHKLAPREELMAEAKRWLLEEGDPEQPWDKKKFRIPGGAIWSPGVSQALMAGIAMMNAKTYGNYPAPRAIMSCVYEGLQVPMDTAIRLETKYFVSLIRRPEAGNMIRTLFINKGAADKLVRRPKGIEKTRVARLGVLGAGMMGAGIAYVSAVAGMEVILLDRDVAAAQKGKGYSVKLIDKRVKRRKMAAEKGQAVLERIKPTADYADLAGCDLIIEAVFEDAALKADVTAKTEAVIGEACVFASNTSTLPITGLAEASKRPEQFIGIHFFSPVDKMPLVEIITGAKTNDETIARALDYVRQIRKTPIVVNDSRGFYTSRCFGTYPAEGLAMLADGVSPALIENAGRMCGMPVGPLAVGDEVSIDLMYKVGKATRQALGDAYEPSPADPVDELFVEKLGRLGRKNGKGFYDYPEGGKKHLWPGLADHFPLAESQPDVGELKKRFLYRQAIEVARCYEEKVLIAPEDADVGAIFGWGFAPFTGGPLSMIDTIGVADFVAECDRLAQAYGPRFDPPQLLREMAKKGETFYKAA